MNKKINIPLLAINLAIPLAIGGLSGFLIKNYTDDYKAIPKPPLSPPSWLFPVVWTILFILMGISAYIIATSEHSGKRHALIIYGIQLAVNFAWSPVFFIAKKTALFSSFSFWIRSTICSLYNDTIKLAHFFSCGNKSAINA